MKKIHSMAIVILIITIIISGCGQQLQTPKQEPITGISDGAVKVIYEDIGPSKGGVLKLFMVSPRTLNPLTTQNTYVRQLSSFVFDSLFYEDESGLIKNGLAESFKFSQDGLILDVSLRDNILFHDGKILSSDDVAFTLETIKKAGKKSLYYDHVSNIQNIKPLTKLSFRLILNKPDPGITEKLTFPIVPEHVFREWPIEGHKASMKLIGTGPFKYDSYSSDEITFLRNDSWWFLEAEGGLSHPIWLDGITFKIYPDESQMMQAFQRQQIDIAWLEDGDLDSYSKRSDIFFNKYVSNILEFLVLSPVGTSSSPIWQEDFRAVLIEYIKEYEKENPINRGETAIEYKNGNSEEKLNKNTTINKLIDLGFLYNYDSNYLYTYKNNVKTQVQLSLIYNGLNVDREYTAQWLTEALAEIGIKIDAHTADVEKHQSLLNSGEFDMMLLGCRIPLYATMNEVLDTTKKSLNLSNSNNVILPLFRKYGAVLYHNYIRGERNPKWKNIYNGWQNWYLVYPNP